MFAGLELAYLLVPALAPARVTLLHAAVIALPGLALARFSFSQVVDQDVFKRKVLVWGAGARAASIGTRMRRRTDQRGFLVVGYVGAPSESVRVPADMLVGREGDLVDFVLRNGVHEVVVAMDDRRAGFPSEFLMECRLRGISVCDIVDFLERETGRVSVELARPSHLIYADGFRSDFVRTAGKRAFEIAASLALLAAALPVMLLAALAIELEDGGPVFYRQTRTGQGGRPFRMVKFRSMSVDAERGGKAIWAVRNESRCR